MGLDLPEVLLVLGLLLTATAAVSGWLNVSVLSISVLSLAAGMGLAVAGVIEVEPDDDWLIVVIELALVMTLFADGLLVEEELLRKRWHAPARTLVAAMPLTLALGGLAAKALFPDLSWAEAFLLGAVLTPTDPVVTSSVVSNPGVPAGVRHTLNLESGLNDGLALPFVLFFVDPVRARRRRRALGARAGRRGVRGRGDRGGARRRRAGGSWTACPAGRWPSATRASTRSASRWCRSGSRRRRSATGSSPRSSPGSSLAVSRPEIPEAFVGFNESVSATLQVVVFVLFGALIVTTGFNASIPALAAFIVVRAADRPPGGCAAVVRGHAHPAPEKLFMAWFGPKGVASMLFALLAAESAAPHRTLVFDVASFVILASITAHGLTDTVGANWIARKMRPLVAAA